MDRPVDRSAVLRLRRNRLCGALHRLLAVGIPDPRPRARNIGSAGAKKCRNGRKRPCRLPDRGHLCPNAVSALYGQLSGLVRLYPVRGRQLVYRRRDSRIRRLLPDRPEPRRGTDVAQVRRRFPHLVQTDPRADPEPQRQTVPDAKILVSGHSARRFP